MVPPGSFAKWTVLWVVCFFLVVERGAPLPAQEPLPAAPPPTTDAPQRPPSRLDPIFNLDLDELAKTPLVVASTTSVISASKYVQPINDSPVAINVLTATDIQRSGAKTLPDLLRRFPGVWSWTKSRSDQDIGLMGMSTDENSRVLVLLDGQPVSLPVMGGMQWPQLPISLEDIERVEVIRGGGSALYGANAYSGVINIITKPTRERQNTLHSYVGEGGIQNHTFTYAETEDKLSLYVTGGWRQTHNQGPFDPTYNLGDVDYYSTPVLNAKVEYRLSEQDELSWFSGYSYGPGGYQASPGDLSVDRVHGWTYALNQGQYLRKLSDDTDFSLKGEYYDALQQNFKPYEIGSPEKYKIDSQRYNVEANLLTRAWEKHTLLTGMAYEYTAANSFGLVSNLYGGRNHSYQMLGLFAQDDWRIFEPLSFIPAVRYDYYDDITDQFNPRGTLLYRLNKDNTVRGSIGRSYRRPGIYDQYYEVTWPGGYYHGGGASLPSQAATNYELEYRTQLDPQYSLKLEVCQSRYTDITTDDIRYPGPEINIVASDHAYVINSFIWELEGVPFKDVLKWYANMTLLSGEDVTAELGMVEIPKTMFNLGFQYSPTEKLYFTMDGHYQSSFRAVDDATVTTDVTGLPPGSFVPGFFTTDAKVGYFLTKRAEVGLGVENLFDNEHLEYPLCPYRGRTVYAECRVVW